MKITDLMHLLASWVGLNKVEIAILFCPPCCEFSKFTYSVNQGNGAFRTWLREGTKLRPKKGVAQFSKQRGTQDILVLWGHLPPELGCSGEGTKFRPKRGFCSIFWDYWYFFVVWPNVGATCSALNAPLRVQSITWLSTSLVQGFTCSERGIASVMYHRLGVFAT